MSTTSNSPSDQFDPQVTQADQAMADAPGDRSAQATTWEFTTFDKQGGDQLRYTVTIRPIHEFGRRSKRYKGVMTHHERLLDNVLGVEGLEASVLVTSSFKRPSQQLGNSTLQYVQIFSNSARVYRAHDDSHDPVKATSAVLRKVLQTAGPRIRRDVFGVVFGSVETMKRVGMSHFYGKQPFPFEWRRGEQGESDKGEGKAESCCTEGSSSEAGNTEADKIAAWLDNWDREIPNIARRARPTRPISHAQPLTFNHKNFDILAVLLDLGVDIGVWKVK